MSALSRQNPYIYVYKCATYVGIHILFPCTYTHAYTYTYIADKRTHAYIYIERERVRGTEIITYVHTYMMQPKASSTRYVTPEI